MTTAPTTVARPPPTRADRCDRCPAAARVMAVLPAGELLFCGHHAHEHRIRLVEIGAVLTPGP